ncbi:class I SAM-dependent methyltransferase [Roseinatronobacter monicus]|uniref:Methyltransferase family protein n=1 Tax=Roseinatronobacter monicus TaxID=393481 RepID=A0A543KD93_9RHOB|nr:class I SAM-dependent methyltransferase [Roseinatronobacter monicus]TQM93052.1 methyltransferase family protein [Roseinatronobacter monicus]
MTPVSAPITPHAKDTPFCMPLSEALTRIDRTFGIDTILADEGRDIISPYYIQSELGYNRVHSQKGCMHIALNENGQFDPDGYLTQGREVAAQIQATRAKKVLELGSGMGFNTLALAPDHPDVHFTGLDLMAHHIKTATKNAADLKNVDFQQGSYEAVPESLFGVDVIFGIETLCYASDLDNVARQIAAALVPGGRFVMYDGFRRADFHSAPPDVITAARLFEVTTAVTNGFWQIEDWEAALVRAGLVILRSDDITDHSIAGMRVLQRRSAKFFKSWKYRMLRHVMPKYLIRNAVGGLTGPYMIEGAGPRSGDTQACLTYSVLIAEKPV